MTLCVVTPSLKQLAYEHLKKLCDEYGESVVPPSMWKTAESTKQVMESKCICISVLGQHNSGKSTIINALLGDE